MPRMCWAQIGDDGKAVRIIKHLAGGYGRVECLALSTAVGEIRRKIWERDKRRCTHCGNTVTWQSMEMHERIWRGRGGEVSVENGVTLCAGCHINDPVAGHGNRKPQWKKQVDSNQG
jgi:hypothetical protein